MESHKIHVPNHQPVMVSKTFKLKALNGNTDDGCWLGFGKTIHSQSGNYRQTSLVPSGYVKIAIENGHL